MQPSEFWNCTYRELYRYVQAQKEHEEEVFKRDIVLADALGNKIIDVIARKRPKNISLVKNTFKHLFEKELEPTNHQQTPEEQIRILRSMK